NQRKHDEAVPTTRQPLVLIVDDDIALCATAAAILEQEGYEVRQAHDGDAALATLRRLDDACLVLLDLVMPGASGFELLDAILTDRRLPELNVVIMSGGTTATGLLSDAPILQKPFDAGRLVAT